MDSKIFTIKKSFLIPFAIAVGLLVVLLVLSLFHRRSEAETWVLLVLILAALPVLVEISYRQVRIASNALSIRKFFRLRTIPWDTISQIGMVTIRRKCYLLLTTRKGFHIISSAYGDFYRLVRDITDRVPPDRVEPEIRQQIEDPPVNRGDVLPIWIAVILMTALIVMKLLHYI
ncbi:MAG: hypothetical protein JW902_12190 [Syntrophaceae bacterium]|nr:hypothetical protein [Syntrophaceae bacterium]